MVESNPKDITFTVSGYVLSERQMYDLLREMCEMDEQGKKMIMAEIDRILYPVYHEEKPTDTTTPVAHIKLDENPTD